VVGDFDGDGADDYGCYDDEGRFGLSPGTWFFMLSAAGPLGPVEFGYPGAVPVVGDFDGDLVSDYGCYDAAGNYGQPWGTWHFMLSTTGHVMKVFGYPGTVPLGGPGQN